MKKVYTHESIITISHLRNLLEAQGVAAIVRNDRLSGVLGEVPFMECWPQLWVLNDRHADLATRLIGTALAEPDGGFADWTCSSCSERIEGQFAVCWHCGAQVPEQR